MINFIKMVKKFSNKIKTFYKLIIKNKIQGKLKINLE